MAIIQHVRPVDLQASMAQSATILAQWAQQLAQEENSSPSGTATPLDFSSEAAEWKKIADDFTVKTRQMWQDGWFRDYDSVAQEWSSQQDTMHLAPVFCGTAEGGQIEQLRAYFSQSPLHSGWAPLSWPPVVMTLVGAAAVASQSFEAVELAYRFIDASYRSIDKREPDEHGGLPGVTREYRQPVTVGKWGEIDYVNAGIEGYGWGALSIHLLLRYLLGLQEEAAGKLVIAPFLPQALRRVGAIYRVQAVQWGQYTLDIECGVRNAEGYTVRLRCMERAREEEIPDTLEEEKHVAIVYAHEWEGTWGEEDVAVALLRDSRIINYPEILGGNILNIHEPLFQGR